MSRHKHDLPLSSRVRSYVSRESGAAELEISIDTWDRWVEEGRIPPPAPGFPDSTPRWRWADVDRKMSGKGPSDADEFVATAGKLRHGSEKARKRAAA
jgi:hypothetical protein